MYLVSQLLSFNHRFGLAPSILFMFQKLSASEESDLTKDVLTSSSASPIVGRVTGMFLVGLDASPGGKQEAESNEKKT